MKRDFESLPQDLYENFGRWDKVRMFFIPTQIYHDVKGWRFVHYKFYKHRAVITGEERQH
jgi:hypothetical protein